MNNRYNPYNMDSHQYFTYGVPGSEISYDFSHASNPVSSDWMLEKFTLRTSPNSPLSTFSESDTSTAFRSQEYYSTPENLSAISPSQNSSIEIDSFVHQSTPSPPHLQDNLQLCSWGSSTSNDTNCSQSMKYALEELETVLMGPDTDETESITTTLGVSFNLDKQVGISSHKGLQVGISNHTLSHGMHTDIRHKTIKTFSHETPPCDLKQLLIECAKALSEGRLDDFEKLIQEARGAVSISGEPIQRLGAYLVEGLVARKEDSGTNIYRALRCREPESQDLLSYMHILYEICPYLKFGYMAANGAIAEAFKNEDRVHIIDFQIAQGTQWMTLLQALAARPSGPPHVRITGIDDPVSQYARGDSLNAVGKRFAAMSEKFNIAVEFHAVPVFAPEVTREILDVRPGEALAVNFSLELHHTPDESVDVGNPRDELLRMIKSLSPKVTTLVEQESNTNTTPFVMRFEETLSYYSAIFESIDVTLARDRKERINVEQQCLARDIVNIIACEGRERVERHELLGKWKSRLTMAGFRPFPLSPYVNRVIRDLLKCYSQHYTLVENDGAMLLGWKNRNLISASAWQ